MTQNLLKKFLNQNLYGDNLIPCKLECVGHVQKRLGRRLQKLQNDMKGKKLSNGKEILGKGRLTNKIINKMLSYYGMAIRQNTSSSQNNDKEQTLYSIKKNKFLPHCGTAQICLTTKSEMHFVLGNPIVVVNIGRMVAIKIISHLSICQKLSRIYLCQYF